MLVVEDGTLVEGANSYVSIEDADAYWAEGRGNDEWLDAVDDDKLKWLLEAADYLNGFFAWKGDRYDILNQSMALPTSELTIVPRALKVAQILLANEARSGPLIEGWVGPSIKSEKKALDGVGSKEITYFGDSQMGRRRFPLIESMLTIFTVTQVGSSFQSARRLVG
jgi:hypothetical protein